MKEVIFFSNNQNKIKEVKSLFKKTSINILSLNNLINIFSPVESGKSFEENAKIKSLTGLKSFKKPCFADDSGICIEALGGKPGIKSKNFIEKNGGLDNAFKLIIEAINKNKQNKAYFQTTICLSIDINKNFFFTGILKGTISLKKKGNLGFGYDPIFIPKGNLKTLGEMSIKEKNLISHRSIAIKKLKQYLESLI